MPTRVRRFPTPIAAPAGTDADSMVQLQQLDQGVANAKNLNLATGKLQAANIDVNGIPNDRIAGLASFVNAAIQVVVGAAPDALNTLQELAAALGNQSDYAAQITLQLTGIKDRLNALETATPPSGALTGMVPAMAANATATVTHGKGRVVGVQVYDVANGQIQDPIIFGNVPNGNDVSFDFGAFGAAANQYSYVIY